MHRLVPALEQARASRSRKVKVQAIADALRRIAEAGDDDDLATAARLVSGAILPDRDAAVLGVGWALVASAACEALGLAAADLRSRTASLGDLGDAVGALAATDPRASARTGLTIADVRELARSLAATTERTAKATLLESAYASARPDQAKYLTKALLGELRIGAREGTVEDAIASAFERDPKAVHEAAVLCPDAGDLAVLARHDELARAVFGVGSPIAFMLASPIEVVKAPLDAGRTAWEDKLDGIRVQAHARPGLVMLFARGGGDVSAVFPEVARVLGRVSRPVVLDGELLAVTPELRPRPFQALQARLNRVAPDDALLAATPVALFAFDMLYDGEPILSLPWSERRARLDAFFADGSLAPVAQGTPAHRFEETPPLQEQIDAAYADARGRGHEGIVLKACDAPYEAGRRGSAWRKVKRALGTLDVVITRAERGHGKRAGVLSDYTFAVWDEVPGARTLVDIGKAYSGLTDAEIAGLTQELEARTLERRGGQLFVEPTIVLEVAFDGLQPSTRHASGFALRFPRIARIRSDKRPADADTLATARALYEAQLASGHREDIRAEPAPTHKARTRGAPTKAPKSGDVRARQLGLFEVKDK
jgi:DNA ligase-1